MKSETRRPVPAVGPPCLNCRDPRGPQWRTTRGLEGRWECPGCWKEWPVWFPSGSEESEGRGKQNISLEKGVPVESPWKNYSSGEAPLTGSKVPIYDTPHGRSIPREAADLGGVTRTRESPVQQAWSMLNPKQIALLSAFHLLEEQDSPDEGHGRTGGNSTPMSHGSWPQGTPLSHSPFSSQKKPHAPPGSKQPNSPKDEPTSVHHARIEKVDFNCWTP